MRALGSLWALPWTLLGLALAWGGGCRRAGGLEFVAPRRGPWRWFFDRGWEGITFGEVIVYTDRGAMESPWLQAHERRHVEQYRRLGPFFLFAYAFCALLAVVMGKHAARDSWLEQDASAAANEQAE